jgi:hypothetical protein
MEFALAGPIRSFKDFFVHPGIIARDIRTAVILRFASDSRRAGTT